DVALVELVLPHRQLGGLDDVGGCEWHVDEEDLGRVEQPGDVVGQPEDGRALLGLVGANALEHATAVVQGVGEDVDLGVVPGDGPVRAGLRFADAARPMPPATAPARSVRMSPNRLSVTITS